MDTNQLPKRKSLRLKYYDYTKGGLYFITICSRHQIKYFAEIRDDRLILNDAGRKIKSIWLQMSQRFSVMELHKYVVMPNHFHAIIELETEGIHSIGDIVGAFKSLTTNVYIRGIHDEGWMRFDKRLWQRNSPK